MEPATKKRRPNFCEEELVTLIQEVEDRKTVVEGAHSSSVTKQGKKNAWDSITAAVLAVSGVRRTREEVRKKYINFRSEVKKKAAAYNREHGATGGGRNTAPSFEGATASEQMMLGNIQVMALTGLPHILDSEPPSYASQDPAAETSNAGPSCRRISETASTKTSYAGIKFSLEDNSLDSPEEVQVDSSSPPPPTGDHSYSGAGLSNGQYKRPTSRPASRGPVVGPDILEVHKDIRTSVAAIEESMNSVASSLRIIVSKFCQ